ncbi:MAG: ABC transporter ATP-binding protein [Chloroflexi bacterium]|nr:ABC transporter ATP-binding protein [Chloroflexota bacterium]
MNPLLRGEDLRVVYDGKVVLDLPRLTVGGGETLSIIGPNGSGKSTLLRVLALLERPQRGRLFLAGQEVDLRGDLLPHRRRLAIVMQQPLLRRTSVFENVATGLRFRGLPFSEIRQRVGHWMERLGVAHLEKRLAHTLSGGESQRVSLARALVLEPNLLLLDEPFAALDAPSKTSLMDDLQAILSQVRFATVFVTHDRTEAQVFGHRVAVMFGGQIHQVGTPQEVFSFPATEAVAAFVGVENIITGRISEGGDGLAIFRVGGREVVVVGEYGMGEEVTACIRPEDIIIEPGGERGLLSSARNRLPGRVLKCIPQGPQFKLVVDCGFPLVSLVTKQSVSDLFLAEGKSVTATFKASAIYVIRRRKG